MGMVWVKGTWNIFCVLWPASKDCVCKGAAGVDHHGLMPGTLSSSVTCTWFMAMSKGVSGASCGT